MAMDATVAVSNTTPVPAQVAAPVANVVVPDERQVNEPRQASTEQISAAVEALKAYVEESKSNLNISVDKASGRTVVKVIDSSNDEVIRQIPSEEMLALSQRLGELMEAKGVLMVDKA